MMEISKEKKEKKKRIVPIWVCILIFIGAFFAGMISKVTIKPAWSTKYTATWSEELGTKITDKKTGNIYKVTSSRSSSQTVAFIGNKVKTSVTIPTTIKIKGATYKVTEISTNAFKNNRKLKKVVIGQNIVRIGKNAFYGCKKLTSITIKSSRLTLKNIGKNAFKNTSPKATVKVPKKQKVLYNQILKKRGLNKKAKVK